MKKSLFEFGNENLEDKLKSTFNESRLFIFSLNNKYSSWVEKLPVAP